MCADPSAAVQDTVRCILTMLTDDGTGDSLFDELGRITNPGEVVSSHIPAPQPGQEPQQCLFAASRGSVSAQEGNHARAPPPSLGWDEEMHRNARAERAPPDEAWTGCGGGGWPGQDEGAAGETDEAALAAAESWEPDPVDADPRRSSASRRMIDIVATLVGIYGSKELFIKEYRWGFVGMGGGWGGGGLPWRCLARGKAPRLCLVGLVGGRGGIGIRRPSVSEVRAKLGRHDRCGTVSIGAWQLSSLRA
jgi:hypothetical protein